MKRTQAEIRENRETKRKTLKEILKESIYFYTLIIP